MVSLLAKKLIFHLGEIGFSLDLAAVVEILEQSGDAVDSSRSDLSLGIVGALEFRQTWIPVVDATLKLDIKSTQALSEKTALILKSPEGNWALLVDGVVEIGTLDEFSPCAIPPLLRRSAANHYTQLEMRKDELLVVFEPGQFYGVRSAVQ